MTGPMPQGGRRFTPAELDDVSGIGPEDLAAEMGVARRLEALAAATVVAAPPAFVDGLMAAINAEPSPVPTRAAILAIRRVSLGALLVSIRDAWRVTVGHGFPAIIRAQALALVLLVAALGAGTAAATAGALGVFERHPSPAPNPSVVAPSPDASPSSPAESHRARPAREPRPLRDASPPSPVKRRRPRRRSPTDSAEPGDDHGGGSGGDSRLVGLRVRVRRARGPRARLAPGPDDDHSGSGSDDSSEVDDHGSDAEPTSTPEATSTPRPTETPRPTADAQAERDATADRVVVRLRIRLGRRRSQPVRRLIARGTLRA